jgi:thiamine-phosphate pyrophosphorylase
MNHENNAATKERRGRAREIFQSAGLYCLTDSKLSCGRNNVMMVEQMLSAGASLVQYREKDQSQLTMYRECLAIRELTRSFGATLIVNDDIALAMAVCADGVHVGQDDLPVPTVRRLVGESMLIGLSTHSPEQAQAAVHIGADYIGIGPVYSTLTKKDVGVPVGLAYVDYVARNVALASVAIGGINASNVAEVIRCGADCAAMISDIVSASNVSQKIQLVKKHIQEARRLRG